MKTDRPFTVMIKPVGSTCNMRCRYCYYIDNTSSNHQFMDEKTLEEVIKKYFNDSCGPIVSFIWHGGEPTLAGLDFFKKAVELQKKYLPQGFKCWNNLQTNGLNIDEKWCEFLKRENFDIGLSIDGTKLIHDTYRKDASGNNTYDRIKSNIQLLKRYGLNVDLLCTVNSSSVKDPYGVYNSLKDLNTGWIQFIPIVNKIDDNTVDEDSVDPKEYGRFLKTIFHRWFYNDMDKLGIQLFMEILNVYSGGRQSLCWLQERCGDVPVIESDGKIYSCDHFVDEENMIGNIFDDDLTYVMKSDKQISFSDRKASLNDRCLSCEYKTVCNGGCPKDRDSLNNNYLCEGLYEAFKESDEPLHKAASLIKDKVSISKIMQILRQERSEKWKDVSGNSPCPCGSNRKYKHCCR